MSHATAHALAQLTMSHDTVEALDEISRMCSEDTIDTLDLAMDLDLDLDLDQVDASMIDPVAYFEISACESLDDEIEGTARFMAR